MCLTTTTPIPDVAGAARNFERYPLYFGGRYPPGERCPGSCVLGEALSAPRGVLSRLKFLFYFTLGNLIKFDFLLDQFHQFRLFLNNSFSPVA